MRQVPIQFLPLTLLLLLGSAARAQQPPPPPEESEEEFRLRVAVERVNVPLVVRDYRGEFIYDLQRDDVTLYDNGVPQQLINFELASQPLSAVLLLDTSQRVKPLLERVRKSGILFSSYILGQLGEAAVVSFDDEVSIEQKFTSDVDELVRAVEKIQAGGAETRLADALDQAVRMLTERSEERRRVIIIISEPLDSGSQLPIGVPLRQAQLADISIYTVSLSYLEAELRRRPQDTPAPRSPYPPGVFPQPGVPGSVQTPTHGQTTGAQADLLNAVITLVRGLGNTAGTHVLAVLAQGTGGLNFPIRSQSELEQALNHLGQDIHNQYMLTYRPSNRDEHGFHRIRVQVRRPGVFLRTRPGYYVGIPPTEP